MESVMDRQERLRWLTEVIRDPGQTAANRLRAMELLNKMEQAQAEGQDAEVVIRVEVEE